MLKYNTTKTVSLQDWNELVEETYCRPYNLQQQDGCMPRGTYNFYVPSKDSYDFPNDTTPEIVNGHEMGVSFKAWLARDPKQPITNQTFDFELELFWVRNFYPSFDKLVNDLHSKGLIEEGEYTIIMDW